MLKYLGLDRPFLLLARKLLFSLVRTHVLSEGPQALGLDPTKPVCYVLQRRFLSNILVLEKEVCAAGLPSPLDGLSAEGVREDRAFFFTSRREAWFGRSSASGYSPRLVRLTQAVRSRPEFDVQLVPVNILWGRTPDKESSIWKLLFSESWAPRGSLRQLFTIMLHGRQTLVRFGQPLSLRELTADAEDEERALRKVARVCRVHFRQQREMAIGPDLSHRRTQVEGILETESVKAAIEALAAEQGGGASASALLKAQEKARHYAWEIAADYSYPVVRVLHRFLTWVWTRLYDGVEVGNFDTVTGVAQDHEIVYVPCHRSHIDYLLLSYIVFQHGLMIPHIAAGANLNLPVVGGILRRGGAFFLRRSFKGNPLYGAVFNEYLHMVIARGNPIEYFVEGGRSRTGRLLQPRPGMLAMTVQSYLRDSSRPIVFLPVYVGYEKLFEGRSYVGELMGKPKQKESLFNLILSLREMKKNFGKVHVNFGEPIKLADVLAEAHPDWRGEPPLEESRPAWFTQSIRRLGQHIADGINSAAVANPVNLISLALLATPRHAMDEEQLSAQLDGYRKLLTAVPYADRAQLTAMDGRAIIEHCERLKLVQRHPHALGDVLHFYPDDAVLCSYMRNNVLHCVALPALIACLFSRNASLSREQLSGLTRTVYPFLRAELFLRWQPEELDEALDAYLAALVEMGWLGASAGREGIYNAPNMNSDEYAQLALLGQAVRPTLVRYFISLSVLTQQGSGVVGADELEALCHLLAQRLSLLREFNAPEFFDRAIFRTFIGTLKQAGLAVEDEAGKLAFNGPLRAAASESRYVLPPDVRQSVLHLTRLDRATVEQALARLASKGSA
ncbi:glycerol-3-phosphate 1-O-acyltransferase PlsB [Chitinimonas arctica]|uniref:Glycerol-3-phosphate acyltransferase n=1 Tax=Chitinimonas arctica TaxID=2594795 RepID=A0A516SG28_9NEIS|nr:glycerol-3-phosphate 1-O-acyltransferase PlsB [Chitinimonas arctica]QDQ27121.1 glycerol-3-phosphate 1-O-acyltransferase PlsB [Chitinimonas arctica]